FSTLGWDSTTASSLRFRFDRNIRIVHAQPLPYVTRMATNAILSEEEAMKPTSQPVPEQIPEQIQARRWQAVVDRDSSLDGAFVFGVSSTGIFCRPKAVDGNPQSALVRAMCRYIEQHIEDRLTLNLLAKEFRRSPFHLQRT